MAYIGILLIGVAIGIVIALYAYSRLKDEEAECFLKAYLTRRDLKIGYQKCSFIVEVKKVI